VGNSASSWLAKTVSISMPARLSAKRAACLKKIARAGEVGRKNRRISWNAVLLFSWRRAANFYQMLRRLRYAKPTDGRNFGGFFFVRANRYLHC
jgi:hypothetical protein